MTTMRTVAAPLIAALLEVVVAGCSGGGPRVSGSPAVQLESGALAASLPAGFPISDRVLDDDDHRGRSARRRDHDARRAGRELRGLHDDVRAGRHVDDGSASAGECPVAGLPGNLDRGRAGHDPADDDVSGRLRGRHRRLDLASRARRLAARGPQPTRPHPERGHQRASVATRSVTAARSTGSGRSDAPATTVFHRG
jgi:hypothetical protein